MRKKIERPIRYHTLRHSTDPLVQKKIDSKETQAQMLKTACQAYFVKDEEESSNACQVRYGTGRLMELCTHEKTVQKKSRFRHGTRFVRDEEEDKKAHQVWCGTVQYWPSRT